MSKHHTFNNKHFKALAKMHQQRGFSLVELMITVAILVVIAGIAIPAYNGYIREARLSAARANLEPLRVALEDYRIDNNTYLAGSWDPSGNKTLQTGALGWKPDGDEGQYVYSVSAAGNGSITNSYTITVTHKAYPSDPVTFTKTP